MLVLFCNIYIILYILYIVIKIFVFKNKILNSNYYCLVVYIYIMYIYICICIFKLLYEYMMLKI